MRGERGPVGWPGRTSRFSARAFLGVVAVTGLALIGLSALRLADTAALVSVPTAMFLCVYLSCMASAARILPGKARAAAAVALLAVLAVLAFCGWTALLAAAAVAAVAALTSEPRALAGSGVRVTIRPLSSHSSRTDTVPEVRPGASIGRACGIR